MPDLEDVVIELETRLEDLAESAIKLTRAQDKLAQLYESRSSGIVYNPQQGVGPVGLSRVVIDSFSPFAMSQLQSVLSVAPGTGPFPASPLASGSVDVDLGAGTLAGRGLSQGLGSLIGGLLSAASGPIAPYLLGGGIVAAGFGDELIEAGTKLGGALVDAMIRKSPELAIAFVDAMGNEVHNRLPRLGGFTRGAFVGGSVILDTARGVSNFLVPPAGASELDDVSQDLREGFELERRFQAAIAPSGGIRLPAAYGPVSSGVGPLARGYTGSVLVRWLEPRPYLQGLDKRELSSPTSVMILI